MKWSRASWVIGGVAALAAVYLGGSALAAKVLSTPKRAAGGRTPSSVGVPYREVRFPAAEDGVPLAAWWISREGSRRAVILAHGINVSKATEFEGEWVKVAAGLWNRGFGVLMLDLRGHGESGRGHLSFGLRERRDVRGAVEWLRRQGIGDGAIGVLGVSLGGAAAIGAAAETAAIGAVATDSLYAAVQPLIERAWTVVSHLPQWVWPGTRFMGRLQLGYDLAGARPVDRIGQLAARPVLLIHGATDELCPIHDAYRLQNAHGSAKVWAVPGARHGRSFFENPEGYIERVGAFFQRTLDGGPAGQIRHSSKESAP